MEIEELKKNVAKNIFYLRSANNMTQSELGEKINYSDKAVSKWERGEGLPDVYVLSRLGEMFGVSVDYLLQEHTEQERRVDTKPIKNTKRLIVQTIIFGIIAVAVLLCVTLFLTRDTIYWQIFVYCLPVIFIVLLVFSFLWGKGSGAFLYTSLLIWSVILMVYTILLDQNYWQLFLIGIPAQIIVALCYKMGFTITIIRKTSNLFKRKEGKNANKDEISNGDKISNEEKNPNDKEN